MTGGHFASLSATAARLSGLVIRAAPTASGISLKGAGACVGKLCSLRLHCPLKLPPRIKYEPL